MPPSSMKILLKKKGKDIQEGGLGQNPQNKKQEIKINGNK